MPPVNRVHVSDVRFTPAPSWWKDTGLRGWASCVINDALGVGGLGVRKTEGGRLTLSFPGHKDRNGEMHHHLWPKDDETRRVIEEQVLGELRRRGLLS